ncbi:MAG: (d)CMP kinase [Kingella sp. (in: b-proteobacteria)]|nr:MAG: (d)CMP kinase [Kingella sp. (in: b-proteobacteria)]
MQKVIAIDGPSASGKGTIAARVAQELGWAYLDSGALYRLTALYAQRQGVSWSDEAALAELAAALPVRFAGGTVFLADENVGSAIRSEEIGMSASAVAALPAVRAALLQRQRDFLTEQGLVADGRDMASVVFPQARLKIFLTAAAEVRACRRAKQLGLPCEGLEYQRIVADIQARDLADSRRTSAPLRQEPDAKLLDTSDLSIDETVKKVLDWYRES